MLAKDISLTLIRACARSVIVNWASTLIRTENARIVTHLKCIFWWEDNAATVHNGITSH